MISAVLGQSGFTVDEARNADEAIAMIQKCPPELIISDIRMPGMDGYSLLSTVRSDNDTAPIPFILMTGSGSHGDFRRGMACGADDYLFKPFTPEELVEAVTSRLSRHTEVGRDALSRANRAVRQFSEDASKPIGGILEVVASMLRQADKLTPEEAISDARQINESAMQLDHLARSLTT